MWHIRNLGHTGYDQFSGVGINGKNSEFHAVMGLYILTNIETILESKREQCLLYDKLLEEIPAHSITTQKNKN